MNFTPFTKLFERFRSLKGQEIQMLPGERKITVFTGTCTPLLPKISLLTLVKSRRRKCDKIQHEFTKQVLSLSLIRDYIFWRKEMQ